MNKYFILLFFITFSSLTRSQNVSGTVKNASGNPIVNALVCQVSNPSIYTKTDANGGFTIKGTSSTAFRVGALGFKTIKSTTNTAIKMEVDPLLATDVYHVSFDHLRAGPSYSQDELKKDFKAASGSGFTDGTGAANDRASVDYGVSRDLGGVSLKVKFPKGALKTCCSGVDARLPLKNTSKDNNFESTDLYVSYWIKFSDNFQFDLCGGKLPSLGGSVPGTGDNDARWKGRIMWRNGGSIQFYMELPGDDSFSPDNEERFWGKKVSGTSSNICEFQYTNYLKKPVWHNIELHYRFETPSKPGIFEGWVDGVNYDFMNSSVFNDYRPAGSEREKITINTFLLSTFLGGGSTDYEPTEDIYAWFDEIRVSSKRINEFNTLSTNDNFEINTDKISIYPNPSTGIFNISEDSDWKVYNVLGKSILEGKGKTIDLSNQSKGVYFAKVNQASVKKLVVN
jgi:hypothetical protein